MHGTPFVRITISVIIFSFLCYSGLFGQKKAEVEVDVAKCWEYPLAAGERIAVDGGSVFVGSDGAKVKALSLQGKTVWSSEFGGEIASGLVVAENGLFLVTSAVSTDSAKSTGSRLRSVSKDTGITSWTLPLPDADQHFLSVFSESIIVVSKSGAVQSVDAKKGEVKWTRQIAAGFMAQPAFSAASVVVATTDKQIFRVSLATGEIESMRKVQQAVTALAAAADGELIVGDERGNVSLLNGKDRPNWTFKSGGEISHLISTGDQVLAASHDNFVYFLADRNGGRIWKKRLSGRVAQIAIVGDRYALISSFEEHGVMLIDVSSGKVAGQIAFGEDENLVAAPIATRDQIFAVTNDAAYSYRIGGCSPEKTKAAASP
jgi:outer membrane protein assembly factor BamB